LLSIIFKEHPQYGSNVFTSYPHFEAAKLLLFSFPQTFFDLFFENISYIDEDQVRISVLTVVTFEDADKLAQCQAKRKKVQLIQQFAYC
jgi:hypothetical protein